MHEGMRAFLPQEAADTFYFLCPLCYLQAISNALNGELQELAWKAVVPLVGKLKEFYEYALELGEC